MRCVPHIDAAHLEQLVADLKSHLASDTVGRHGRDEDAATVIVALNGDAKWLGAFVDRDASQIARTRTVVGH